MRILIDVAYLRSLLKAEQLSMFGPSGMAATGVGGPRRVTQVKAHTRQTQHGATFISPHQTHVRAPSHAEKTADRARALAARTPVHYISGGRGQELPAQEATMDDATDVAPAGEVSPVEEFHAHMQALTPAGLLRAMSPRSSVGVYSDEVQIINPPGFDHSGTRVWARMLIEDAGFRKIAGSTLDLTGSIEALSAFGEAVHALPPEELATRAPGTFKRYQDAQVSAAKEAAKQAKADGIAKMLKDGTARKERRVWSGTRSVRKGDVFPVRIDGVTQWRTVISSTRTKNYTVSSDGEDRGWGATGDRKTVAEVVHRAATPEEIAADQRRKQRAQEDRIRAQHVKMGLGPVLVDPEARFR